MKLSDLKACNARAIASAGPRYTPGLDPAAPNITIQYLADAFDALSLVDGFRSRLKEHSAQIETALKHQDRLIRGTFRGLRITSATIQEVNSQLLRTKDPKGIRNQVMILRRVCDRVITRLETESNRLLEKWMALPTDEANREERSSLDSDIQGLRRVSNAVGALAGYLSGAPGTLLADKSCLLLLGSWGTGKTHFLCDVAQQLTAKSKPALLILASSLPTGIDPLDGIAMVTGLATSGEQLTRRLNQMGKKANCRALLIVDAINEGDRETWRKQLRRVVSSARKYPHLAVVVSCRRPFNENIVSGQAGKLLLQLEHVGFQEEEFDAQFEFFKYYDIPAPSVPLITPEFSRPLFLKILCEALQKLAVRSRKQKLREIASGQKGMTYVLEYFAKEVGRSIESDLVLPPQSCWKALKGSSAVGARGIAGTMADAGREWLTLAETHLTLKQTLSISSALAATLTKRLIADGLLAEDLRWNEGGAFEVVQFPYQRFGDHVIARHLLDTYLAKTSESAIRRCFYANQKLGEIFQLDRWGHQFKSPGIAAAIMLEFPERLKRTEFSRELLHYLPKGRRLVTPVKDIFLHGLYWRSRESFTAETDRLVAIFLGLQDEWIRNEVLEVLTGLASRPGHPYSARRLRDYLSRQSMQERDRTWTEFLRVSDPHDNLYRILAWTERTAGTRRDESSARNELQLLSLFLTTNNRPLRDRATRALVLVGSQHPQALFDEVLASLPFNDPYVPERMLAAAYGIAMRLWADPKGANLREHIVPFAKALVRHMFSIGAPHATKHILMREYARGVIALARKIDRRAIGTRDVHALNSSLSNIPSPFVADELLADVEIDDAMRAMKMDFRNYTLGRLIPGRGNYDDSHPEYQAVRRQIARRMLDLGYSSQVFGERDKLIDEYQWRVRQSNGEKTDRYGKKYSWIAFFEMYGVRSDEGKLAENRLIERASDLDLDPSFPSPPVEWMPTLPRVFQHASRNHVKWLKEGPIPDYQDQFIRDSIGDIRGGPWVLLDGYIRQEGSDHREIFTFLRGLLMKPADVARLKDEIAELSYLGNHRIPEAGEDYYTFAGEIPWSTRFGTDYRLKNGRPRRNMGEAPYYWRGGHWRGGARVEVPVHRWSWGSEHSQLNQIGAVEFPAPALCEFLGLVNHSDSFDLWEKNGRRATIYREFEMAERGFHASYLLYLRRDLLVRYLDETEQVLVWIPWGERTLHYSAFENERAELQAVMQAELNNFGRIFEFPMNA